jgi:hypothetical protein
MFGYHKSEKILWVFPKDFPQRRSKESYKLVDKVSGAN